MSLVQQNKPELLTKAINSFVEATIDHMLKASSFLVSLKSPKGTTKHQFPLGRLGNKDAIAQTFKDAKGNYIICPHDLVANIMTSMRSNGGTLTDKIRVLVYLVIWSCLSQDCYYSITLALLITDKKIKHHLNSFQFDQGEITKDCIWHWLQCLTMCIMCTGSLSFQKMYTMTTHACLVFALPAAILDSCHIFTQIGVNPVGPIFNINPVLSPEILERSILKENPLLLMTHTFTLWCSRRLKEEIGIVKTTDHLQAIAESLKSSGKNSENASTLTFFTKNFSSIHAKEKFSMCMVSEEPTPKPEMSKRGNLPLNAKGPTLTSTKHISSKKGPNGTGISSPQRLMQDYFFVETRKKVGEKKKQTMDGTTVVGASGEGSQSLGMTSSTKAKASLGGKPPLNKKSSTLNKKKLSITKANSPSTKHVSSKKGVNGTGISTPQHLMQESSKGTRRTSLRTKFLSP